MGKNRDVSYLFKQRDMKNLQLSSAARTTNLLKALQAELKKGLENISRYAERQKVITYWNMGKLMLDDSAQNGGAIAYEDLAKGVGLNVRTLQQTVQFAREYPKLNSKRPITWSHYRFLFTITSTEERLRWEKRIIAEGLKTEDFKALLIDSQAQNTVISVDEKKVLRGQLYTYRIIKVSSALLDHQNGFVVDCGFDFRILPPPCDGKIDNTRIVTSLKDPDGNYTLRLSKATVKEIYTYKAIIEKVIDADTYHVNVDCGFGTYVHQKLRLAGIDAPELRTAGGIKAKKFVEGELSKCPFVIIKTYKSDKYDRYLVDIFYDANLKDPAQGKLLNHELLKRGLAVQWKPTQ